MESFGKKLIKAMEEGLKNLKEKPESPHAFIQRKMKEKKKKR